MFLPTGLEVIYKTTTSTTNTLQGPSRWRLRPFISRTIFAWLTKATVCEDVVSEESTYWLQLIDLRLCNLRYHLSASITCGHKRLPRDPLPVSYVRLRNADSVLHRLPIIMASPMSACRWPCLDSWTFACDIGAQRYFCRRSLLSQLSVSVVASYLTHYTGFEVVPEISSYASVACVIDEWF